MKTMNPLLFLVLIFYGINIQAQNLNTIWTKTNFGKGLEEDAEVENYRLDKETFLEYLSQLNDSETIQMMFPIGNDQVELFDFKEMSTLSEALQAQFPNVKSYIGVGVNNPSIKIRVSTGTNGIHVTVHNEGQIYIISPEDLSYENYAVYKSGARAEKESFFTCHVENSESNHEEHITYQRSEMDEGVLRTFRMALACTGEYAQYHLQRQGVSIGASDIEKKTAVLSAINASVTRANSIFENDLSVTFQLVDDNLDIIYLDPNTDPYTSDDIVLMINENQTNLDLEIGSSNYDVGHVFGTFNHGGLAYAPSVCSFNNKAKGATSEMDPIGDLFDIRIFCHELGHQFGANHTFGNLCGGNRNDYTAYEPGSGSTIMSYAGVCSPNIQFTSDPYFHTYSLWEMAAYLNQIASCPSTTSTGNSAPTIEPFSDYSIPKSTPFVLRGNGNDVDGNGTLTYTWEQLDNLKARHGPTFRSRPPTTSPDRYMPQLGSNSTRWEELSDVARRYNFVLVVRDNDPRGGRYALGPIKIDILDVPPFRISQPLLGQTWPNQNTTTISWAVGQTAVEPINCSLVDIILSTDGGLTYTEKVAEDTPNDGSEVITIPESLKGQQVHVMVMAVDNIFYALSDFGPPLSVQSDVALLKNVKIYPNPTSNQLNVDLGGISNASVTIYNTFGALVYSEELKESKNILDVSDLKSGLYVIEVKHEDSRITEKLIVE